MTEICRATLGDEAYFFFDQFVVKGAEKGAKFATCAEMGAAVVKELKA